MVLYSGVHIQGHVKQVLSHRSRRDSDVAPQRHNARADASGWRHDMHLEIHRSRLAANQAAAAHEEQYV